MTADRRRALDLDRRRQLAQHALAELNLGTLLAIEHTRHDPGPGGTSNGPRPRGTHSDPTATTTLRHLHEHEPPCDECRLVDALQRHDQAVNAILAWADELAAADRTLLAHLRPDQRRDPCRRCWHNPATKADLCNACYLRTRREAG